MCREEGGFEFEDKENLGAPTGDKVLPLENSRLGASTYLTYLTFRSS